MDEILEAIGDEWTWEFMRTDGGNWYAWATHTNDQEHFKFTSSNKSLVLAAADVALQIQEDGPLWARTSTLQKCQCINRSGRQDNICWDCGNQVI